MHKYFFQYCQKVVVFSKSGKEVLLCKRKGENDYDGVYSFIGGKMENTDRDLIDAVRREKNEEIGQRCTLKLYPLFTINKYFQKKDGNYMILPHYYAEYNNGVIQLSAEYSKYQWVLITDLKKFEPKISNIPEIVEEFLDLRETLRKGKSVML